MKNKKAQKDIQTGAGRQVGKKRKKTSNNKQHTKITTNSQRLGRYHNEEDGP